MDVSISPDGSKVASVSQDRTLKLWDAKTGQLLQDIRSAHNDFIYSVAFDRTGTKLVTGSKDKTIRLWRMVGNSIQRSPLIFVGHTSPVRSVTFNADGNIVASGSDDGQVRLWTLEGKPLHTPIQAYPSGIFTAISFNRDGTFATSGYANNRGVVKLWNQAGRLIREFPGNQAGFSSIRFSPDGRLLAASDGAGVIHLWRPDGTKLRMFERRNASRINSISFSANGLLAAGSNDNSVEFWRVESPQLTLLKAHTATIQGVAVDADGTIATASEDGSVKLWSPQGQPRWSRSHGKAQVLRVSFHPQQRLLVSADTQGVVNFWNTKTGNLLRPALHAHNKLIYSVSFSPDGRTMVTTSADKTAKLWTLSDTSKSISLAYDAVVYSASFSSTGTLATASADGTIRFWDKTGQAVGTPMQTDAGVLAIAFSPQENLLILGDQKGNVKLWDGNSNQLREIGRHSAAVWGISFSPDGQMFATASDDGMIQLWKTDGTLLTTLIGHKGNVNSVSFHPKDSQVLVSGGQDALAIRWNLHQPTLQGLLKTGCHQLSSYLQTHSASPDIPSGICNIQ
jgi:WD40 repeat protein